MAYLFQIVEVKNPLHTVTEKHEVEFRDCLECTRYQYAVGLMISANLFSERFGAIDVSDTPVQQRTDWFFKKNSPSLSSKAANIPFMFKKLANSGKPKNAWA